MNIKAWVAEFVGTFGFVFVGVGSGVAAASVTGGNPVAVAIAHGFGLAVMISAVMSVSGGYLNPAITIAGWMTNKLKLIDALGYIIVQIGASVAAIRVLEAAYQSRMGNAVDQAGYGVPEYGVGVGMNEAFCAEAVGAFFLTLAVFGTAIDKRSARMGGLFIGGMLLVLALAIGPISGSSLNPARYFGPAMAAGTISETWAVYLLAPVLGALVAALLYEYLFMDRSKEA